MNTRLFGSALLTGLLLAIPPAATALEHEGVIAQTHGPQYRDWNARQRWELRRPWRDGGRWGQRHVPRHGWPGGRWYRPEFRRGWSATYWHRTPRHFWPTQRLSTGTCYRVDRLPDGRVRRIPLPNAACF